VVDFNCDSSVFKKDFLVYLSSGKEVSLENPEEISAKKFAPDEVAVFYEVMGNLIILSFVEYGDEKKFNYKKVMLNHLMIMPKTFFAPSNDKNTVIKSAVSQGSFLEKYYRSRPPWWK